MTVAVEMLPVESSNLASIGYDRDRELLYVRFKGNAKSPGSVYAYAEVPGEVHQALMEADRPGERFIKGRFSYRKLADGELQGTTPETVDE